MAETAAAAKPSDVNGSGIDPDADSLQAVAHHAQRRLKRLRTAEDSVMQQLVDLQRQIGRERIVLMLNGIDPDTES